MLSENLKRLRKAKGLSQEELAMKINVVRQTVSKWEKGLSVPDSELLIRLAEALDTSAGALLGEAVGETETADLAGLAAKLELLNKQFARQNESRRKRWRAFFIILLILTGGILIRELIEFIFTQSALYSHEPSIGIIGGADGPTAILVASAVNPMEQWLFALIAAILAIIGICKTGRR